MVAGIPSGSTPRAVLLHLKIPLPHFLGPRQSQPKVVHSSGTESTFSSSRQKRRRRPPVGLLLMVSFHLFCFHMTRNSTKSAVCPFRDYLWRYQQGTQTFPGVARKLCQSGLTSMPHPTNSSCGKENKSPVHWKCRRQFRSSSCGSENPRYNTGMSEQVFKGLQQVVRRSLNFPPQPWSGLCSCPKARKRKTRAATSPGSLVPLQMWGIQHPTRWPLCCSLRNGSAPDSLAWGEPCPRHKGLAAMMRNHTTRSKRILRQHLRRAKLDGLFSFPNHSGKAIPHKAYGPDYL